MAVERGWGGGLYLAGHDAAHLLDLERDAGAFAQLPSGRFPPIGAAGCAPLAAS